MEYGVYLESSIVDLKPRVLEFLTKIVDKAKEAKDFAISFKKKELAELTGKDIRTTSRYLKELEERNVIETRGVRGRSGGTVILFNTELIRFDTSDKALVNSDEPISIDDIVERKLPKKKKEPKNNKRNRRTKQQMIEAEILNKKNQSEASRLNSKLEYLGGVPDWEWFKETEDPVGNYRTYLLSRLYNRYAALFTDDHNYTVDFMSEGNKVPTVSDDYDVLPREFYGTARWHQFEKLRDFCEENDIDPAVYLSAQFGRSVFDSASKKNKKMLPFVNALIGDSSYEVYKQYCQFKKNIGSPTYLSYNHIPAKFMEDSVVVAIREAYDTAERQSGVLQYMHCIKDFLYGFGSGEREDALLSFYDHVSEDLRGKVSFKTRNTLKKFIILQSLTLTGGGKNLPSHFILGSETTRIMLASINSPEMTKEDKIKKQSHALGVLVYPSMKEEEQKAEGLKLLAQLKTMHETPLVLRLILQRKGLHLSLADLQEAFKEYGRDKIPVDDFSCLDVDQIVEVMSKGTQVVEIDHEDITRKREWDLEGSIVKDDNLESALSNFLNSTQ
jgi:hypothetical protein